MATKKTTICKTTTAKKPAAKMAKSKILKPTPAKAKRPRIPSTPPPSGSKGRLVIEAMKKPGGVTAEKLIKMTGWVPHTLRGFISSKLRKAMRLKVKTETDGGTRYRIV